MTSGLPLRTMQRHMSLTFSADPARRRAIEMTDDLLARLRIEHAFVGSVARAAWLGDPVEGSVDVLAMVGSDRKAQIPMMASNRGFELDRDAIEAADELDLVPLSVVHDGERVRIHVLVASNSLYARMVTGSVEARVEELAVRVVNAEDLALLVMMSSEDGERGVRQLIDAAGADFDLTRFNDRLVSIGLQRRVVLP